jgi:hypothetical protein
MCNQKRALERERRAAKVWVVARREVEEAYICRDCGGVLRCGIAGLNR